MGSQSRPSHIPPSGVSRSASGEPLVACPPALEDVRVLLQHGVAQGVVGHLDLHGGEVALLVDERVVGFVDDDRLELLARCISNGFDYSAAVTRTEASTAWVGELEGRRTSSPFVFPGRFPGRPISPATVWAWTKQVGEAAGIPELEPHELRHTALTTANDSLGDLRAVQTFARHSDPATTAIYTRTRKQRLRDVSESLDYL